MKPEWNEFGSLSRPIRGISLFHTEGNLDPRVVQEFTGGELLPGFRLALTIMLEDDAE
jgi:hypothetical protein